MIAKLALGLSSFFCFLVFSFSLRFKLLYLGIGLVSAQPAPLGAYYKSSLGVLHRCKIDAEMAFMVAVFVAARSPPLVRHLVAVFVAFSHYWSSPRSRNESWWWAFLHMALVSRLSIDVILNFFAFDFFAFSIWCVFCSLLSSLLSLALALALHSLFDSLL